MGGEREGKTDTRSRKDEAFQAPFISEKMRSTLNTIIVDGKWSWIQQRNSYQGFRAIFLFSTFNAITYIFARSKF